MFICGTTTPAVVFHSVEKSLMVSLVRHFAWIVFCKSLKNKIQGVQVPAGALGQHNYYIEQVYFKVSQECRQGRINHCAICAMAWGPRRRGPPGQLLNFLHYKNNVRQM